MKKRSLKLVVSLILAMTMIMGMSMTAFAADQCEYCYLCGHMMIAHGYSCVECSGGGPCKEYGNSGNRCALDSGHVGEHSSTRPHSHSFATAWSTDETNHWHACTADGNAASCLSETDAAKAEHGGWDDGKCGTCGYACTHGGATSGTCSTCGKNLDTPAPTPCEHTWTEWKYAPSVGDEWRYCTKCHINERRAVASTSTSSSTKSEPAVERSTVEETMPVSPVSVDATGVNKADSAVIPGGTYNLSNFITTKGIVRGINTAVAASNKNGSKAVTIYSGKPFCFNGEILKAIQTGKKDVTYFFNYNGHLYSVTIPASVDASKVLDKAGFAGPLYVGQQLGTTVLVK